ncbi:MAG: nickel pincer cofactor biosynthesis protein LarC [Terriglobia bacterium]|jgi:uncharacterized protein (TIGR00299 family) protein
MKQAYLDCFSGISGDMFVGALLDVGLPLERLLAELKKIPLGSYEFERTRALRGHLVGTRVEIRVPGKQPHRKLRDIEALIADSGLSTGVKEQTLKVFSRLAQAEGKLHNMPPEQVHFHEVGAVDAILDIVGTCIGLELLDISHLTCSPVNVGSGCVQAAHGTLPVPAPASLELLKDLPIYSSGIDGELVTPTGAALISTLATGFGPIPPMRVERIGYGAGAREIPGHPNLARLLLGESAEPVRVRDGAPGDEVVSIIEANVDDMSPQLYGYFIDQALAAGALDVTCTPIQMKKDRPGILLSVLCTPEKGDALAQMLFEQTTTIGVRIYEARRQILERELVSIQTAYGTVKVKVARRDGKVLNVAPEYEDCQRLASEKGVPLKQVMIAAQASYLEQVPSPTPGT